MSLETLGSVRTAAELADASGRAVLASAPGQYRILVERTGSSPWRSAPIRLSLGDTLRVDLAVPAAPRSLAAIRVVGTSTCAPDDDAGDVASAWSAARVSLFTAQEGAERFIPTVRVAQFEREFDLAGRLIGEAVDTSVVRTATPFFTLPPSILERDGYRRDLERERLYFAPDAGTLLSEAFARSHCFRLVVDPRNPELLGLSFVPSPGREQVDISGSFWLDRESGALARVDFRYVNAGDDVAAALGGGTLEFGEIAPGLRGIRGWMVRTPRMSLRHGRGGRGELTAHEELAGSREEGARVAAADADRLARPGATGTIVGSILDAASPSGGVVGARVTPMGIGASVLSDSAGSFRIDGMPAGAVTVRIDHERLRLYRVPSRHTVEIPAGDSIALQLQVPSARDAYVAVCGAPPVNGRGALVARVVDATLGYGVAGAEAQAAWRGRLVPTAVRTGAERAFSDEIGHLVICALSSEVSVRLTVRAAGYRQEVMSLAVPAGAVLEREVRLVPCRAEDLPSVCPTP